MQNMKEAPPPLILVFTLYIALPLMKIEMVIFSSNRYEGVSYNKINIIFQSLIVFAIY